MLLIVALSAFVVDRSRRLHERETTARMMLLALGPAALVMIQPDLGTALVYVTLALSRPLRRRHARPPAVAA